jgi:hypothetical protein
MEGKIMTRQYRDQAAADAANARFSANWAQIESWGQTNEGLVHMAANFATPYIVGSDGSVQQAYEFFASLENDDERAYYATDALAWQMIGACGSEAQRAYSDAIS